VPHSTNRIVTFLWLVNVVACFRLALAPSAGRARRLAQSLRSSFSSFVRSACVVEFSDLSISRQRSFFYWRAGFTAENVLQTTWPVTSTSSLASAKNVSVTWRRQTPSTRRGATATSWCCSAFEVSQSNVLFCRLLHGSENVGLHTVSDINELFKVKNITNKIFCTPYF